MPVVKGVVEELLNRLLEDEHLEPAEFDDEGDLRDIWADTSDIERFPRGTPIQVNREHAPIHGLKGKVVKSRFDKAIIRLNPGEWERGGLVGEPEDFILPIEEIIPLSESEEDLDVDNFDTSAAQDVRDVDAHTLADMKAAEPGFFSRENNKFFGTKKVYQYGHFLVLKNRRKRLGHFGNIDYHTSYVVYEFKKTEQNPQGTLLHRGSSGELSDAKAMIKTGDFRSRYERMKDAITKMGKPAVAESDEDEFDADLAKEIGTPDPMPNWRDHSVLRETKEFALVTFQNGKTGLICLLPNHSPERVRIKRPEDIRYLMSLSDKEFEMSACMEYGCGVWATSDEESEEIERDLNDGG